jgi:hypothetical protein
MLNEVMKEPKSGGNKSNLSQMSNSASKSSTIANKSPK